MEYETRRRVDCLGFVFLFDELGEIGKIWLVELRLEKFLPGWFYFDLHVFWIVPVDIEYRRLCRRN